MGWIGRLGSNRLVSSASPKATRLTFSELEFLNLLRMINTLSEAFYQLDVFKVQGIVGSQQVSDSAIPLVPSKSEGSGSLSGC